MTKIIDQTIVNKLQILKYYNSLINGTDMILTGVIKKLKFDDIIFTPSRS